MRSTIAAAWLSLLGAFAFVGDAHARGGHHGGFGGHHPHAGGAFAGRGFGPVYRGVYPRYPSVRPTILRGRSGRLGVGALLPSPSAAEPPAVGVCDEWSVDGKGMPCGGYQHVRGPIP